MQLSSSVPSGQSCQPSHTDSSARHSPLPQENSAGLQVSAGQGGQGGQGDSFAQPRPRTPPRTGCTALPPTLRGVAGLVGGEEAVVCHSFIRNEQHGHDVARGGQGGWQLVAAEPAGPRGKGWGQTGNGATRDAPKTRPLAARPRQPSVSPAEPRELDLGRWGGGVPAHQAGGPGAGAVVHLHEVEAAVLVRLQAEVVEAQIHHVAHGHRDLPQAQLPGRGDTVKPGRGTR